MAVQETVLYKVSRAGVFLGLLTDVKPSLGYNQLINSPGAQVVLELSRSANTSSPIYGDDALLQEGNDIEIIKFNSIYPNGKTKFTGYISSWTANFGGVGTISVTCLPYGQIMNEMVIESGDTAYITNNNENGNYFAIGQGGDKNPMAAILQTFTVAANKTIGAVSLMITTASGDSSSLGVVIRQRAGASPNPDTDTIIMSGHVTVAGGTNKGAVKVTLPGSSQLNTGNTYYIMATWSGSQYAYAYASSANPYASGQVFATAYSSGTSWDVPTSYSSHDLWFTIWEHGGSTEASYTSQDPTAILSDIISFYNQAGGIVQPPANPITPLLSQPISSGNVPGATWGAAFAQTFTPTSPITINIVQLLLSVSSGTSIVQVKICRGDPTLDYVEVNSGIENYVFGGSNVLLGTCDTRFITNTSSNITGFSLSTPLSLSASVQYYVLVEFAQDDFGTLIFKGGTSSDSPIAPFGNMYYGLVTFNNSNSFMAYHSSTPVFYCNIGYELPIPASIDGGFPSTGVSATYTFKVNTVLEGIQKMLEYSPAGWYWYIDMGTNILYFLPPSTTADHTMILGQHINELNLTRTSEYIKNVVYYTGGDDGSGDNVFVKRTNPTSLASYPIGLDRSGDNLVTTEAQADILAQDVLDRNDEPVYQTTIKIPAGVYDLDSFQVGQMVGFGAFNNFVDTILLQIVGIRYSGSLAIISLGSVAPRSSQTVSDLKRGLIALQTLNNPASPS